ncbi:DUF2975 domain-containing protein [Phycicoccus sp. CSK15P-2]|uniref:DUF2975 domain-containing protein n=1 Tax=Phycicoccus sp. CSK15P-2 TaxID=2807627 RepID=UPI0019514D2D|nr:DUF2975 domain-containing protein [Phycicoccus sp. CSK15P-2]MBM6405391.1 DUF2975 domain-containing protein [Phycicoccus sp. CSK15P-2]
MRSTRRSRQDPWGFDRTDRYAFVGLLGLVVLVQAAVLVGVPAGAWVQGDPLPVRMLGPVTVPALDAAGVGYGEASYEVAFDDPSVGLRLLALVPGVLTVVLAAWATWLVVAVMRAVASGEPFAQPTVRRLRTLAAVLAIGAPVVSFVELPIHGALLGAALDPGGREVSFAVDPPWEAVVAGLFVALLAEAFVVGGRLRDDVEGLV